LFQLAAECWHLRANAYLATRSGPRGQRLGRGYIEGPKLATGFWMKTVDDRFGLEQLPLIVDRHVGDAALR
jgi:hypothetical protein